MIINFFQIIHFAKQLGLYKSFFQSPWWKIASAARNCINSIPQAAATTFAFSSVSILLLLSDIPSVKQVEYPDRRECPRPPAHRRHARCRTQTAGSRTTCNNTVRGSGMQCRTQTAGSRTTCSIVKGHGLSVTQRIGSGRTPCTQRRITDYL